LNQAKRGILLVPMRTVFALCWLIIASGVVFYTVVGVTHH
jgi:hypothetical protein